MCISVFFIKIQVSTGVGMVAGGLQLDSVEECVCFDYNVYYSRSVVQIKVRDGDILKRSFIR